MVLWPSSVCTTLRLPVLLTAYANELDNLQKQLRTVEASKHLKPIYVSAQKILELHDKVAERVRKNLDISVF
jgi:hypothetical protein